MPEYCLVCDRISQIKNNINPYFVAELETGYVVLGDYQYFEGYTILLCKQHVRELHELDEEFRYTFLKEMSQVAEAVFSAFKPLKLNYEMLGNTDSHAHWHIFPRHKDDPTPKTVTWIVDKSIRYAEKEKAGEMQLKSLKEKLLTELNKTASNIR